MSLMKINLACGDVFIDSAEWINLDFAPASPAVRKANLLARLPVPDSSARVVYASHFFEHVPRDSIPCFLQECFRILAPDGSLRLVLPDFEEMASKYLKYRSTGDHEKADFLIVEIIDQAVRQRPGGELGDIYRKLRSETGESVAGMRRFINDRNGETFGMVTNNSRSALNSASKQEKNCVRCSDDSSVFGYKALSNYSPDRFAHKTSAWLASASGTNGFGTFTKS